jgi:hypothetical protein
MTKQMGRPTKSLTERFWQKVTPVDGCWEWHGGRLPGGYGRISAGGDKGRMLLAHRVSWQLHNGLIPEGMDVLHRCDNRPCVNPAHLFLGTGADNMADKVSKGRQYKPRGETNAQAKLDVSKVGDIRTLYASGRYSQAELGRQFGVSQTAIGMIVRGETWQE